MEHLKEKECSCTFDLPSFFFIKQSGLTHCVKWLAYFLWQHKGQSSTISLFYSLFLFLCYKQQGCQLPILPCDCTSTIMRSCNETAAGPIFTSDLTGLLLWFLAVGAQCKVEVASENALECVMQSAEKTHYVSNQGAHPSRFTLFLLLSNRMWVSRARNKRVRVNLPKSAAGREAVTRRLQVTLWQKKTCSLCIY